MFKICHNEDNCLNETLFSEPVMSPTDRSSELNYDEVLEYIGQFGSFQRRIFFLLWFVSAAGGIAVMVFAFTGLETATVDYLIRYVYCRSGAKLQVQGGGV